MTVGYERAVNEIIPAVRAIIAKELKYKYEMKEAMIAYYLDVAQAAVSKYLNGKYSDKIKEIEAMIDTSALSQYIKLIAEGKKCYTNLCVCKVCKLMNSFGCTFSKADMTEKQLEAAGGAL